jgi:hypothetical protein
MQKFIFACLRLVEAISLCFIPVIIISRTFTDCIIDSVFIHTGIQMIKEYIRNRKRKLKITP